jgi:signal transduction histidine kinase
LKYAPEGGQVRIGAEALDGHVRAHVANPVGEHAPDPRRMFERFYRADPSRSSALGGVGLGLAISRELAAAQRGQMWADVDPAGHLRVWLSLPVAPPN